jgi:hypothetical protein
MPKKMRRGALRSALSERLREGNIVVIDEFEFKNPKTSEFVGAISGLKLSDDKRKQVKTLIVDSLDNQNLILSSRNVERTTVTNSFGLNIYDIVNNERLLISKSAIEELNRLLDPAREGGREAVEEKPKGKKAARPKAEKEAKGEEPAPEKKAKVESASDEKPAKAPAKPKAKKEVTEEAAKDE